MKECLVEPENAVPFMAQLLLSVPPEVKNISSGSAPMHRAIVSLEFFSAFFAVLANE